MHTGIAIVAPAPMPGDLGDLNADGLLNGLDIQPFIDVILQPAQAGFRSRIVADLDGDGAAGPADISPFAAHLVVVEQ
ncbi:MAG TPA: hypothetical protein VJZ71_12905 [Phycisphaerae bacterium]|nr:hypothetical protein [Phycisphaerae bacterium]